MKFDETISSSSEIKFHKQTSSPRNAISKLCRKLSRKYSTNKVDDLIQRVFAYFDEDGDGKICAAELESCVRTVGGQITLEEAELVVSSSDSDGDGKLGFEDFVKLMEASGEDERKEELKEAFGLYAMEGSECITPKSLKRMMSRLGESTSIDDCKAMIRKFDLNGDGVLNFDEFRIMMH